MSRPSYRLKSCIGWILRGMSFGVEKKSGA
jgi:hypothetical protein